jgi:HEPN domain-containing protein
MEDDIFEPNDWIARAESNLVIGTAFPPDNLPKNLYIEDLCFELQQCVEKAIKAILIRFAINFPKTHNIAELFYLLKKRTTVEIPERIVLASNLTKYAVKTRYPHWNKLSVEEYKNAIELAKNTLNWAKEIIAE